MLSKPDPPGALNPEDTASFVLVRAIIDTGTESNYITAHKARITKAQVFLIRCESKANNYITVCLFNATPLCPEYDASTSCKYSHSFLLFIWVFSTCVHWFNGSHMLRMSLMR